MKTLKNIKSSAQILFSGFFSVFFFTPVTPAKKVNTELKKTLKIGQEADKKALQNDYKNIFSDLVTSYQKMI